MHEIVKMVLLAMIKGIYDSFKGMLVVFYLDKEVNERARNRQNSSAIRQKQVEESSQRPPKKHEKSKVVHNVIQCALLNGGVFLLSVLLFEYVLLPTIDSIFNIMFGAESFVTGVVWLWVKYFILLIYRTAWLIPLFLLSKIINALWFQDIADSAYRYSRGKPTSFPSISMYFADSIFSIVVQCLFLIQTTCISYLPFYPVGYALYYAQMSLLYSLYSFEYKWFNMGWELHKRLSFIEENWPYFIGFGLPLTILTQISESFVINGCVFSILFPLFIISGNEANPVILSNNFGCNTKIFSFVIIVANVIFSRTIGQTKKVPLTSGSR
ncbi:hypothetical protein ABEB36_011903 [Hypothenemus hampei]|uniref:Etoposide-induced protein 2.4 homolog n=1 Tax=Hypothenemus hampei TaxID=57062 RepID=A0ABD1EC34_HYPHA